MPANHGRGRASGGSLRQLLFPPLPLFLPSSSQRRRVERPSTPCRPVLGTDVGTCKDQVIKLIHPLLLLLFLLQEGEGGGVHCHATFVQPWHAQQWGRQCARSPWQQPLRLGHSCEPVRPTPTELLLEQREELGILPDTGGLLSPWGVMRTRPPTTRSAVVGGLHQCRRDRHPLMSPP